MRDWTYDHDTRSNLTSIDFDPDGDNTNNDVTTLAYEQANLLCWTAPGTPTGGCSATPADRSDYSYDAAGNLTNIDDTSSIDDDLSIAYDVQSNQCWTHTTTVTTPTCGSTPSGATDYEHAGLGQTDRTAVDDTEFTNAANGTTAATDSSNGLDWLRLPDGTILAQTNGTTTTYLHADYLGSIRAVTNNTGALVDSYNYSPYGEELTPVASPVTPWRYAGQYLDDATGHYKMGARYYQPTTGRFTQPDPSKLETNTYLYVASDPLNKVDVTGLILDEIIDLGGAILDGKSLYDTLTAKSREELNLIAASEITGFVVEGLCLGTTAYVTGGIGLAAAGGCFAAGEASSTAIEAGFG